MSATFAPSAAASRAAGTSSGDEAYSIALCLLKADTQLKEFDCRILGTDLSTKALNADFNPDVDGCESFVMRDGSVCAWVPGRFAYAPRPKA